ncbi:acyl transferase/acyl hydrolase/lysophospholipase [Aspergillus pseudoustus]|uniref:Lysophospholipase n=1 Tax=Aspergillus pseudoustus TaxID=1810923 RepID=A0ABR4KF42_9EURO
MKLPLVVTAAAGIANAASLPPGSADITVRALPDALDGYTRKEVASPSAKPPIRDANRLSGHETEWLKVRRKATLSPMKELLGRLGLGDFDASAYLDKHSSNIDNIPNIAVGLSGGAYRAMTKGAGALKAFDVRTKNATETGHLGGLLQSSTYKKIIDQVRSKSGAGFNTSFTDYWSRFLSFQLINSTTDDGGASFTWSSIADIDDFKAGQYPLPMVVMDGRNSGEMIIETNATAYEVTPWEFGSWDPTVYAFAPLKYLGTKYLIHSRRQCLRY